MPAVIAARPCLRYRRAMRPMPSTDWAPRSSLTILEKAGTPATVEGGLDMNGIAFDQFLAQVVDLLCAVCADYAQSL